MDHSEPGLERRRNTLSHAFGYLPKALSRKRRAGRRMRLKNLSVIAYVNQKLMPGWSPEQISGRIHETYPELTISHEAVYQYVYHDAPELIRLLPRRHKHRHAKRPYNRHKNLRISNRKSIEERPLEVNSRLQFGHWEADSMVSGVSQPTTAQVLVERKSRLVKISKLRRRGYEEVKHAIIQKLLNQDPHLRTP